MDIIILLLAVFSRVPWSISFCGAWSRVVAELASSILGCELYPVVFHARCPCKGADPIGVCVYARCGVCVYLGPCVAMVGVRDRLRCGAAV